MGKPASGVGLEITQKGKFRKMRGGTSVDIRRRFLRARA
jgi:hypothetical protein